MRNKGENIREQGGEDTEQRIEGKKESERENRRGRTHTVCRFTELWREAGSDAGSAWMT